MKVLFLSRWFPCPPDNGSRLRVYNLLRALAARREVHLLSFTAEPPSAAARAALAPLCARVETVPFHEYRPGSLRALAGLFAPEPSSVVATHNAVMQARVQDWTRETAYDVILASELGMAPYAAAARGRRRVLEDVELAVFQDGYLRERQPLKRLRRGLTWWKMARYTRRLLRSFAGCTVVSSLEQARLASLGVGRLPIAVIPNGVDMAAYTGDFGAPEPDTLVYSGALTYQANREAVEFFVRDVFPLVRAQRPQARLYVTGRTDGVALGDLGRAENVVFTGYLEDVRPRVARAWCAVAPLRTGGGTRLKILEALALGVPVVATAKGAEGLELSSAEGVAVADEPQTLADAVLAVLADRDRRAALGQRGRAAVAARYDWAEIGARFDAFLQSLAAA